MKIKFICENCGKVSVVDWDDRYEVPETALHFCNGVIKEYSKTEIVEENENEN